VASRVHQDGRLLRLEWAVRHHWVYVGGNTGTVVHDKRASKQPGGGKGGRLL